MTFFVQFSTYHFLCLYLFYLVYFKATKVRFGVVEVNWGHYLDEPTQKITVLQSLGINFHVTPLIKNEVDLGQNNPWVKFDTIFVLKFFL